MFRTAIFTRDDSRKSGGSYVFGAWRERKETAEFDLSKVLAIWEEQGLRVGHWDEVAPEECREDRHTAFDKQTGKWLFYVEIVDGSKA